MAAPTYKRIIAYLIDLSVVNLIINSPFRSLLSSLIPKEGNIFQLYSSLSSLPIAKILLISLVSGIFAVLYWAILEYRIQQTLGCIILNIKVKPLSKRYTFSQSLIRNITKLSTILLILDSFFIFGNEKKQRFTEKLSDTMTI